MFRYYTLYACTVFLSSFLLFQVQPLIGKHILPWYGGSSAVWMTALLFFMVALAIGYGYVLFLSRLSLLLQVAVHSGFVFFGVFCVWYHSYTWPSGITPTQADALFALDPTLSVLLTLVIAIGVPFIVLSSTSSLLQLWYARLTVGEDPTSLYSVSNIGSLLGLLSYPFVVEPLMSTATQGWWWTVGFALYTGFMVSILWRMYQLEQVPAVPNSLPAHTSEGVLRRRFWQWLLVASVPVMVLLAGTTFMTTTIAPIPLLWVGPLALYLSSFIWSFRAKRAEPHLALYEAVALTFGVVALAFVWSGVVPVAVSVVAMHAVMMAIFHWCHEYLYNTRPEAEQLPLFYVALSLGGIVGSVVIKVSSLWVFALPIEFNLLLVGVILVILYRWFPMLPDFFPPIVRAHAQVVIVSTAILIPLLSVSHIMLRQHYVTDQVRNFFGDKAIVETKGDGGERRALQHGLTNHGFQRIEAGVLQIEPVSYYATSSGVGRVFAYLEEAKPQPRSVAVVGLGTGGLAAYCRPGDTFTFIEIDPQVIALAYEYFTYLTACSGATVIEADGRLALAQLGKDTKEPQFDLLVLDAYADDMIPIHLMTIDAIREYLKLLDSDGIIAINISSRYLNLVPVAAALAQENDLAVRYMYDKDPVSPYAHASQWIIMAKQAEAFKHSAWATTEAVPHDKAVYWTDTYSALLPTIKLW